LTDIPNSLLDPLLDDHAVAQLTGRARSTLQKDRVAGNGIPFVKVGRLVRYRRSDVEHFLNELPAYSSTSEVTVDRGSTLSETFRPKNSDGI
jgi:excisionase family DNA binding protein